MQREGVGWLEGKAGEEGEREGEGEGRGKGRLRGGGRGGGKGGGRGGGKGGGRRGKDSHCHYNTPISIPPPSPRGGSLGGFQEPAKSLCWLLQSL